MKTPRKQLLKQRELIIPKLVALEKQHGDEAVRSAMRKHLFIVQQTRTRQKRIAQLSREIANLKGK